MKYSRLRSVVLTSLLFCFTASLGTATDFDAKIFKSAKGKFLNYRIHLPEKLDPKKEYPFVLFFHGAGERGSDNKKQLIHGVKDLLAYSKRKNVPSIIVAPQCLAGEQWVNTPWGDLSHKMPVEPSDSMQLTIELLRESIKTLPVDKKRIYVTGLSMGGFGTWDILQRMPNIFAAAIPVCGGGDTEMANAIKTVPLWVFHGGSDNAVKTKRSQDMVAALRKVGGKVKYTEYRGVGHNSWDRTYRDENALAWLFHQSKGEQLDQLGEK